MKLGISDSAFVALVRELDGRVAAVDGRGFSETPLRLGAITIKDETSNVAGSHKGRHLMGLMIWLRIAERIDPSLAGAWLAIASCGNAALGAAVVARAAERALDVFVPADAPQSVVKRLETLGARVSLCERKAGQAADPAYLRFREAVANGALPFTCQKSENGLVTEGGQTLGWEIALQLARASAAVDRLFIQAGGGALASNYIAGLEETQTAGVIGKLPRIHAVQPEAVAPLRRAWEVVEQHGLEYAIANRKEAIVAVGDAGPQHRHRHPRRRDVRLGGDRARHAAQRRISDRRLRRTTATSEWPATPSAPPARQDWQDSFS